MRAGAGRLTPLVAWAAAAAVILIAITGAALAASTGSPSVKRLVLSVVWALPGAFIAAGRPRIAVGWLLLAVAGLFSTAGLADQWVHLAGPDGAGVAWAVWWSDRFSALVAVLTGLVLLTVPDGRLPSHRWRVPVTILITAQLLAVATWCLVSGPVAAPDSSWPAWVAAVANPVGVLPAGLGEVVAGADLILLQAPLLVSVASLFVRFRRAEPAERTRVAGVLLAGMILVAVVVLGHLFWPAAADLLDIAAGTFFAAVLTAAVLRRQLDRVDVIVHHTVVFTVLTVLIAACYVAVNGLAGLVGRDLPPFGAGVVAAAVALATLPLRGRLQRGVDRWIHGDRNDPYAAIQRLERAHLAPGPEKVLSELAAAVAGSLRVPWAQAQSGDVRAECGARPASRSAVTVPLLAGNHQIGSLSAAAGPARTLNRDDTDLLTALGRHGGLAVQAAVLGERLQASRERLVLTRAEEQRRLRRDLHDGLGPTLAGLSMQLGAIGPLVARDPTAASRELARLHDISLQAVERLRDICRGLRPPALDQLGLVEGLRQLAVGLGLDLRLESENVTRLPAAIELAAYHIAGEALTNVARHSGSRAAELNIRADDAEVTVAVADHGRGDVDSQADGVGLLAMRERAEELGGRLVITAVPNVGTTVTATLPVSRVTVDTSL